MIQLQNLFKRQSTLLAIGLASAFLFVYPILFASAAPPSQNASANWLSTQSTVTGNTLTASVRWDAGFQTQTAAKICGSGPIYKQNMRQFSSNSSSYWVTNSGGTTVLGPIVIPDGNIATYQFGSSYGGYSGYPSSCTGLNLSPSDWIYDVPFTNVDVTTLPNGNYTFNTNLDASVFISGSGTNHSTTNPSFSFTIARSGGSGSFNLTALQNNSVLQGTASTFSSVLSCSGYSGTVNFSASTAMSGAGLSWQTSPTNVICGSTVSFTYSTGSASPLSSPGSPSAQNVTLTGTATGLTTQTATGTLTVYGAPTATLSANPTAVSTGGTTTLTWSSQYASGCTASSSPTDSNWSGGKGTSGSQVSNAINASTTFSLFCTGFNSATSATQNQTVGPMSFSLSPMSAQSIVAGSTATWGITVTCSGGFAGPVNLSANTSFSNLSLTWSGGSQFGVPCGATRTINATSSATTSPLSSPGTPQTGWVSVTGNGSGVSTQTATGNLTVYGFPAVTQFTVSPFTVASGSTVNITWNSQYASNCTASANPANANWSGSKLTSGTNVASSALNANTTFSIYCTGFSASQSTTQNTSVTVTGGADFSLSMTATNSVLQNGSTTYTITASCSGTFTGPVTGLNLSSAGAFTGLTPTFSSTAVSCGGSVTLTIGTGAATAPLSSPTALNPQALTVTGTGAPGNRSTSGNLTVYGNPTITSFTANPSSISSGQSSNLTYTTQYTNATGCTRSANPASGFWQGSANANNATNVTTGTIGSNGTYSYSLQCTGALGSNSNSQAVSVIVGPATPGTININYSMDGTTCTQSGGCPPNSNFYEAYYIKNISSGAIYYPQTYTSNLVTSLTNVPVGDYQLVYESGTAPNNSTGNLYGKTNKFITSDAGAIASPTTSLVTTLSSGGSLTFTMNWNSGYGSYATAGSQCLYANFALYNAAIDFAYDGYTIRNTKFYNSSTITNGSGGGGTISSDVSWMSPSRTTTGGGVAPVWDMNVVKTLLPGTYYGHFIVTSGSGLKCTKGGVTLKIENPGPITSFNPDPVPTPPPGTPPTITPLTNLYFEAYQNAPLPPTQEVQVTNTGNQDLSSVAASIVPATAWLGVNPASQSIPAKGYSNFNGGSNDASSRLSQDAAYIYSIQTTGIGGNWYLRKYSKKTGQLVSGFGSSGTVTMAGLEASYFPRDVKVDGSYIYLTGWDPLAYQSFIERRRIDTGALCNAINCAVEFGSGGVLYRTKSSGVGFNSTEVVNIAVDDTYLWLAGQKTVSGTSRWFEEKRYKNTGLPVNSFGAGGYTADSGGQSINSYDLVFDNQYSYQVGQAVINGKYYWRVIKRSLVTGAYDTTFGSNGTMNSFTSPDSNCPQAATASSAVIDNGYILLAGSDCYGKARVEKRSITNGVFDSGFGSNGLIIVTVPGATNQGFLRIRKIGQYIVLGGYYSTGSANIGYMEKRKIADAQLCNSTGGCDAVFGDEGVIDYASPGVFGAALDSVYSIEVDQYAFYIADTNIRKNVLSSGFIWDNTYPTPGTGLFGVQPNTTNLSVGTYTTNIQISGGSAGTQTVGVTYTILTPPPSCPSSGNAVSLGKTAISVDEFVTASPPGVGWSGGTFAGSSGATNVSGNTVTGVAVGADSITGTGWTAPNGAVNCSLSAAAISVGDFAVTSAPNTTVTQGQTATMNFAVTASGGFSGTTVYSESGEPAGSGSVTITPSSSSSYPVSTPVSIPTSGAVAPGTYTIIFTATYAGGITRTNSAQLIVQGTAPPTVDIQARKNFSDTPTDGPLTIGYNVSPYLSWTSTNAASCTVTGNAGTWSGLSNAGQAAGNQTTNQIYTLNCTNSSGTSASDSVTVNVFNNKPVITRVDNFNTDNTVPCAQIKVTWNSVVGASAYRVFRNTSASTSGAIEVTTGDITTTSFTDTTPPASIPLYYFAKAIDVGGNYSDYSAASSVITATPCGVDISVSDMDIVKINGLVTQPTPTLCNSNTQSIANSTSLINKGNVLTFQINICNSGTQDIDAGATPIVVTETLTNLTKPGSGWAPIYSCNGQCAGSLQEISVGNTGTTPDQIKFTLSGGILPKKNNGSPGVWSITFSAATRTPSNSRASLFRFNNSAFIQIGGISLTYATPYYFFYFNQATPIIKEVN